MTAYQNKLLWDTEQAADSILFFTAGFDLTMYRNVVVVQSAVEREFEKLGEAARRLREDDPDFLRQMPSLRGAIAFRNFLIHVYDEIDHAKVWSIIESELPSLRAAVKATLAS